MAIESTTHARRARRIAYARRATLRTINDIRGLDWRPPSRRDHAALCAALLLIFSLSGTSPATADELALAGTAIVTAPAKPVTAQTFSTAGATELEAPTRDNFTATIAVELWPVSTRSISDGFGHRTSPCAGCSTEHLGIDLPSYEGAPVRAAIDGVVTAAGQSEYSSYGNWVVVSGTVNGAATTTIYAHLSAVSVRVGQIVTAGNTVGAVGHTGAATGNHLHFEVHINGVAVNPLTWLNTHASN